MRLDLSENYLLGSGGVSALLDAVLAAGCPLTQLDLAGCGGGGGGTLARLLAGPAPLQRLTLPEEQHCEGAELADLWRQRYPHQAAVSTSPDGDLVLELTS